MNVERPLPDETIARLEREGPVFGFHRLVEVIEQLLDDDDAMEPRSGAPRIRFRHDSRLSFPTADVSSVRWIDATAQVHGHFEIVTSFLGLTGSTSPLPYYLAEEIEQLEESSVPSAFLDIFHHRLLDCVYRIRAKYRVARRSAEPDNPWVPRLLALAGIDTACAPQLEQGFLLRLMPLLATGVGTADGLPAAVAELCRDTLLDREVELRTFTGGWTEVDEDQHGRLGRSSCTLGLDAVLGTRCCDRAGRAVLVLRVGVEHLEGYLPGGRQHAAIAELVRWWCATPVTLELEIDVIGAHDSLPGLGGFRLGHHSWLGRASAGSVAGRPAGRGYPMRVPLRA